MSYNGSVRCSWCYEVGHNRRTCPKYQSHLEDVAPKYLHEQKKRWNPKRRCSFCGEHGHNRATCKLLTEASEKLSKVLSSWKQKMKEEIEKAGLGLGALLIRKNVTVWNTETSKWEFKDLIYTLKSYGPLMTCDPNGETFPFGRESNNKPLFILEMIGGKQSHAHEAKSYMWLPQSSWNQNLWANRYTVDVTKSPEDWDKNTEHWEVASAVKPQLPEAYTKVTLKQVKNWMKKHCNGETEVRMFLEWAERNFK